MTPTPTPAPPALPPAPSSRSRGRVPRLVGVALLVIGVVVGGVVLVTMEDRTPAPSANRFRVPALNVLPGTVPPPSTVAMPPREGVAEWAARVADATDIPARALEAYANADLATRERDPGCNLSWSTLAGVGRVESHHGHINGSTVGPDGRATRPIVGVALNGAPGVKAIRDTDGGRLDGDQTWDRAVGAMQFLPSTWEKWSRSTAGDAPADPQDIDDAAMTAARYLCASGGDLSTGEGWWKAVFTYNQSVQYGRDVYSGADAYSRKAAEVG